MQSVRGSWNWKLKFPRERGSFCWKNVPTPAPAWFFKHVNMICRACGLTSPTSLYTNYMKYVYLYNVHVYSKSVSLSVYHPSICLSVYLAIIISVIYYLPKYLYDLYFYHLYSPIISLPCSYLLSNFYHPSPSSSLLLFILCLSTITCCFLFEMPQLRLFPKWKVF